MIVYHVVCYVFLLAAGYAIGYYSTKLKKFMAEIEESLAIIKGDIANLYLQLNKEK